MNYKKMSRKELIKLLEKKENIISDLYLKNKKLKIKASIDEMTGILNRDFGVEELDKKFNQSISNGENMVICIADIDELKGVNDKFGHHEGNELITNVAKVLKENIRKTDFIVRMGGDEFLIVFPKTERDAVDKIWNKILKLIQEVNQSNEQYNVSISYGFYEFNKLSKNELTRNEFINKADKKMYKMKRRKKANLLD